MTENDSKFFLLVMCASLIFGTIVAFSIIYFVNSQSDIISSTNETITVYSTPSLSEVMTNDRILLQVDKYYHGRLLIDKTYNVTIETHRIGDKWITYCENC